MPFKVSKFLTDRIIEPAPAPKCIITNKPARYKDPKTGLPYYDSRAYKEIQKLQSGDYKWSQLVGAWVGTGSFAAQGVPARFLDPDAPAPPKPVPPAPAVKQEPGVTSQDQPAVTTAPATVPPMAPSSSSAPTPTGAPSTTTGTSQTTQPVTNPPPAGPTPAEPQTAAATPLVDAPAAQNTVGAQAIDTPTAATLVANPPPVARPAVLSTTPPPPPPEGAVSTTPANSAPVTQQT